MDEGGIGPTESEFETNLIHSSLYSRHSQYHVESLSLEISTIMTKLGYGEEIRRRRVEKYKEFDRLTNELERVDRLTNAQERLVTQITAGSKAEGLSCIFESDFDRLFVLWGVLCVEPGINRHAIPDDIDLFRMETRVYPGHCILVQEILHNNWVNIIQNALCDNGYGEIVLSSTLWVNEWSARSRHSGFWQQLERAGPSIPDTTGGIYNTDNVVALRCHCPSILQRWAARPRHWPSPDIVQKVVSLGAYLAPVGCKGSEDYHMEWRICFNTGEAELVTNLNDTQAKVYVMLKMILKEVIKPNNKEITSYGVKNIILWQAEKNPGTQFHARSLFHWLHEGLRELRTAIERKQLCYYMISERNLMAGCRFEDALQRKWVADITAMMEEGPSVILRLEKIRKAIVASPEPLCWFGKKRMEMEMLELEWENRIQKCKHYLTEVIDSDFIAEAIRRRLEELYTEVWLRTQLEGSSDIDLAFRIFK